MKLRATLNVRRAASPAAHEARDILVAQEMATRPRKLGSSDLYGAQAIVAELNAHLPAATTALQAAAKKLGLSLRGAPDVLFCIYGGTNGPIEFTYQAWAE